LRIVPVIDLMGAQVVRGIAGRRHEYRPVESILCNDARPSTVATALSTAGFRQAYVADLDAIGGQEPAWTIYEGLAAQGLDLWIDAGLTTAQQAIELARFRPSGKSISGVVAGLESLAGPDTLSRICTAVGSERLIFSLDMKAGELLTGAEDDWSGLSAVQVAVTAIRLGVRRMILLDLASVGMGQGVGTEPLCRQLRSFDPQLEIIAGGGVRGWDDLRSLEHAGCNAALVASALHDGRLPLRECAALR
jgi:phosphoribosylformimino-5-aminoimidazole carboxamide ribotide isomerase